MINRMDKIFNCLARQNEKILVLYFPIGDTILEDDCAWAEKYFKNGCTVLEIGLPNEDPILDGQTVRDSMSRALSHTNLDEIFLGIKKIREKCPDNILQIMTYYQIIDDIGIEKFADICNDIGVDGVLSPNIPPEKMSIIDNALLKYNIYNLRFAPYHLTADILEDLKKNSKGYIFQQATDGETGTRPTVSSQVEKNVNALKKAGIKTPVIAGFGISNADQAKEAFHMGADGVIVGSAVISHIQKGEGCEFISSLHSTVK